MNRKMQEAAGESGRFLKEKGGKGAEDQIGQAIGADNAGQDAPREKAPGSGGTKEGKDGKRLGEAALEDAECKAEEWPDKPDL